MKKIISYLLILTLVLSQMHIVGYTDDGNASLPVRIEGYKTYLNQITESLNEKYKEEEKATQELYKIRSEYERLKRVGAIQLYTVLLSFGIDVAGALTLNPLEVTLNYATALTEYQEMVTGWSGKKGAERARDTLRARDILAGVIPIYENKVAQLATEIAPLQEQYLFAQSEITRLMAMYQTRMNEPYLPKTDTKPLIPVKAQEVSEVTNAPASDIVTFVPGYLSALEAANALFESYKPNIKANVGIQDFVLPSEGYQKAKKVYDDQKGMERFVYTYQTPPFEPEKINLWSQKAVPGGVLQVYIETQRYTESGQTRYKAMVNKLIHINTPLGQGSTEQIKAIGKIARSSQMELSLTLPDPEQKLSQIYWYAVGKKAGESQSVYIGLGNTLVTDIPVNLYGFDELVGYSASVIDIYMGKQDFSTPVSLYKGINSNYTGINVRQLYPAINNQIIVIGGEIALPEYGQAKVTIDYNGQTTLYDTVPTADGALVFADFKAIQTVPNGKIQVDIYASGVQIGHIPWDTFTLNFDKTASVPTDTSSLDSGLAAIQSTLSQLETTGQTFVRTNYASLIKYYSYNASYATTITKHIQGEKDPNFQYTVQYALDNDHLLIEYLDGLSLETGLGDQRLVNSLKNMKIKGYPSELTFIDIFYLYLEACVQNQLAIEKLMTTGQQVVIEMGKMQATLEGLKAQYPDYESQNKIQQVESRLNQLSLLMGNIASNNELMTDAIKEVNSAVGYLEKQYPEAKNNQLKYTQLGLTAPNVRLLINNQRVYSSEAIAKIKAGRIMVPLRLVAESLQCVVEWRKEDKVVVITSQGKASQLLTIPKQVGQSIRVFVDGKQVQFDVAPTIESGRTLVPIRQIAEALGGTIDWDSKMQTASIKTLTE